jgi:hypothetical protein
MITAGDITGSIAILQSLPISVAGRNRSAAAYAELGRYDEAADALLAAARDPAENRSMIEDAARLIRSAPQKTSAPQALPVLEGALSFVYAHVGAEDRLMDVLEREVENRELDSAIDVLWRPTAAALRKTERFEKFIRDAGLVEYWRESGWPDLCKPTTGENFECN